MLMEPETNTTFVMSSKLYDFLKKLAQIWLPALGTLYFALAAVWGLPAADKVTGTIIAVDTFLGVILNISKNQYVASGGGVDGTVTVTPNELGTSVKLGLDPNDLVDKSKIVLKVTSKPPAVP
jgi:hypothetical protein